MSRLLAYILLIIISSTTLTAREIRGIITSVDRAPLSAVMVKVMNGQKIAAYSRTNQDGEFIIKISEELPDTLRLVASCIGYDQIEKTIDPKIDFLELEMRQSTKMLREVTVEAPKIAQRGDTTRFRLGAFTGKSDQTLEDGLKRLPGVEVAETGKISYLGKEISDFYVENLQLAGSNYGVVTKNMPAEYVTEIELIENHQKAAMDKGKISDDVALNVKLSNKAKFRPIGTTDAMAGYQKNRFIYRVGATGMMFSSKFQTLLSLKAGNYGRDRLFSSDNSLPNYAQSAIGSLTGATPPLHEDTYSYSTDLSASINFIRAFSPTKTLRVNLAYNNERSRNYYSQKSIYSSEDGATIEFSESGDPFSLYHIPSLNLLYNLNDSTKYLSNNFSAKGDITTRDFNVLSDGRKYDQHQRLRALSMSDNFALRKKIGLKSYTFTTSFSYIISPTAFLSISSPGIFNAVQNASAHTFRWKTSTGFDWSRGKSFWFLPLNISISSSRLRTNLDLSPDFSNNIASTEANVELSPRYEFITTNRKTELTVELETRFQSLHAKNRMSDANASIDRFLFSPRFRLKLNPSSRFSITFNGGINHTTGDILDLLTREIMTDFRNIHTSSGIVGKMNIASASVKAEYKNAVNLVFADASASYSNSNRNTISSLDVDGGEIQQTTVFYDNSANHFNASAMISKDFYNLGVQFLLRGNFNWSKSNSIQQQELITAYSTSYSIMPHIVIKPLEFFEIRYNASIGKNFTRFVNSHSGFFSMSNDLRLSIYPALGWDIFAESSLIRKEISAGYYKNFSLFNAGITWKHNKYRFTLKADNLLNTRDYSYTIFNGINIYSYDFRLAGRTLTFKCTINL